ncbi:MAG: beta galactosidase jelly roll domain-containing protein [Armatimonadota bacterium]
MLRKLSVTTVLCIAFGACATFLWSAQNPYAGKKLIEYGWDVPDTVFVNKNISEMEKVPFDGLVISVRDLQGCMITGNVWTTKKFKPEEYNHAINDLKATNFKRFTDNFIQVFASFPYVDWYDPNWSTVAYNAACLAKVAKQGGCKGIMLDCEHYGGTMDIWKYDDAKQKLHTIDEYKAMVRQRGREFIRAINKEYPDITILSLFAYSFSHVDKRGYVLLPAFFDGMCEAASPGTIIIDGCENTYGHIAADVFSKARQNLKSNVKMKETAVPDAYAKHMRVGFAAFPDYATGTGANDRKWYADDYTRNAYSPDAFRTSLANAMKYSDKYVWVYSERLRWWGTNNIPANAQKAYINVLSLAKSGPAPGKFPDRLATKPVRACDLPGYDDNTTFAKFKSTMTEVFDFPKAGWRFKHDDNKVGKKDGWYAPDLDDSSWRTISIGKFWHEEDTDYQGAAWYRIKFTAPSVEKGKRVFLVVGAADESAWIWLNGKFIGAHDIDPDEGWDVPFAFDVTSQLKPNQENVVAVEVLNRALAGGLWKSIKLMTK